MAFKPEAFYADNQITLTLDTEVLSIDRAAKTIETQQGTSAYDFLVLCTGSSPRKLNLENADLPEVLYLRDLQDAETIKAKLADASHITLLGGGYIGLELANSRPIYPPPKRVICEASANFALMVSASCKSLK